MSVICAGDQEQTNYNNLPGGEDVVPIINISLQTIHRRPPISGRVRQWPNDGGNDGPALTRWPIITPPLGHCVCVDAGCCERQCRHAKVPGNPRSHLQFTRHRDAASV